MRASELPGSFKLSSASQYMVSFSRPARPAIGGFFNRCTSSMKEEFEESGMSGGGNKPRDMSWNKFSDIKNL